MREHKNGCEPGGDVETNARHEECAVELERAKTNFINLASHELRSPVGVARGYLSMVREGDFGEVPSQLRSPLEMVTAKVDQVWRLVEQLMEVTRRETSGLVLRQEKVDLRQTLASAADEMQTVAEAQHVLIVIDHPTAVPVLGDRSRLAEAVIALLDNAVKYSPGGGEIRCQIAVRDSQAVLSIRDQGLGIAPEHLPQIFARFGRVVTRLNSHIPGTGLGLYLARQVIRQHQGEITVDSTPGQGSTFRIHLPLDNMGD
jgi:two-component system, OmpR family, phosphate regulon sensor histidine kinase PhoR